MNEYVYDLKKREMRPKLQLATQKRQRTTTHLARILNEATSMDGQAHPNVVGQQSQIEVLQ